MTQRSCDDHFVDDTTRCDDRGADDGEADDTLHVMTIFDWWPRCGWPYGKIVYVWTGYIYKGCKSWIFERIGNILYENHITVNCENRVVKRILMKFYSQWRLLLNKNQKLFPSRFQRFVKSTAKITRTSRPLINVSEVLLQWLRIFKRHLHRKAIKWF